MSSTRALNNNDILWLRITKNGKSPWHGPFIKEEKSISKCMKVIEESGVLDEPTLQGYRNCLDTGRPIPALLTPNGHLGSALQTMIQYHEEISTRIRAADTFSMDLYVVARPTMYEADENADTKKVAERLSTGRPISGVGGGIETFTTEEAAFARAEKFSKPFASEHGFLHKFWKATHEQHEHWLQKGTAEGELKDLLGGVRSQVKGHVVNDFVLVFRVNCKLVDAADFL
jgi:hypothetical protein